MSLHRCAACGSQNIVTDTQTGEISYNYKKGIIGTVILGTGGAVARIENKTHEVFKCQDCGVTLSYEMPAEIKNYIDIALDNEDARIHPGRYTSLPPLACNWKGLRRIYKNIEAGGVDQFNTKCENNRKNNLLSYATATQEEFDAAIDLLVEYKNAYENKKMTLVEYLALMNAITIMIENLAKFSPDTSLGESYNFVSCNEIDSCFFNDCLAIYIFEKCNYYNGKYPKVQYTHRAYNSDVENYVESDPFILDFLNYFWVNKFLPIGSMVKEVIPWSSENFYELFRKTMGYSKFLRAIPFRFEDSNGEKITFYYLIPNYIVRNGHLCYWIGSKGRVGNVEFKYTTSENYQNNPVNGSEFKDKMTAYEKQLSEKKGLQDRKNIIMQEKVLRNRRFSSEFFLENPDKEAEFNSKLVELKKQLSETKRIEKEKNMIKQSVSSNEFVIKKKQDEIVQLRKKFFGRKSAYAKADALEKEIDKLKKENTENLAKIKKLDKSIKGIVSDREFYKSLIEDMDCFVVWHNAEEME